MVPLMCIGYTDLDHRSNSTVQTRGSNKPHMGILSTRYVYPTPAATSIVSPRLSLPPALYPTGSVEWRFFFLLLFYHFPFPCMVLYQLEFRCVCMCVCIRALANRCRRVGASGTCHQLRHRRHTVIAVVLTNGGGGGGRQMTRRWSRAHVTRYGWQWWWWLRR